MAHIQLVINKRRCGSVAYNKELDRLTIYDKEDNELVFSVAEGEKLLAALKELYE